MQGIKFNQQGIECILACRKTMTRRPIGSLPLSYLEWCELNQGSDNGGYAEWLLTNPSPKYKIGETVFVQEEFFEYTDPVDGYMFEFKADSKEGTEHMLDWQPASEMTEQQSRIKLKIIGIKVERLHDISEEDCVKEGVLYCGSAITYQAVFKYDIWNKLHYPPKYQWSANPYVFVYEFEVVS